MYSITGAQKETNAARFTFFWSINKDPMKNAKQIASLSLTSEIVKSYNINIYRWISIEYFALFWLCIVYFEVRPRKWG